MISTEDYSRYNPALNADFPAKAFVEQFKDPKNDPSLTQTQFLQGFHSFYKKYISTTDDDNSKSLLELGGGPSLFTLISAAKHVGSITFSDYAESNRKEVLRWKDEKDGRKS